MKRFYKFLMPLVAIVAMALPWNAFAQETVEIGTDGGTTTNSYLPIYTLYNNTLSEQIYTAAEIGMAGNITSIAFYNGGTEKTPLVKIYMINTTQTDFSSTTSWLPVTAGDLVFQGNVTFTANQWTTITLDTPFEYDGTSNLGLVVDGNLAWSSGLACRVFSSTSNCAMYVYSDGTDYDAVGATYTANSRLSVKNQLQLEILGGDVTCYPVKSLTATDIDPEGCTLTWLDTSNSGASYIIYNMADSSVIDEVTDTFFVLTGLNSNTVYQIGVRANCGAGDTSGWRKITFRTACSFVDAVPVTEDFESYGSGTTVFPTCWYKLGSTADRPYINATTTYGHNNSHGLYFYAAASGYCYGIMPPLDPDLDITTLQVHFWARQYSTSYNCDFVVGVMTDPTDATTFEAIDTVHPAGTTYEDYEIPFVNYTGTGTYIAFSAIQHPGTSTAIYMMLDDVTIEEIPACPRPSGLTVDAVTPDSVYLHISDAVNTEWVVVYGPAGFNPDTAVDNVISTTNPVLSIGGLTSNTPYDVYLMALCATGDTTPSRMINFRTACDYITEVPVTEDFESYGSGTTAFPTCWYKLGSTADRPYINATTTYGHNNSYGLYFYASSSGYCYGIMPPVDTNTLDLHSLQVHFWARQYSTSYNCDFVVGVMSDPTDATTFVAVDTVHPAGTTYEEYEIPFMNFTGDGNYIAFSAIQHPGTSTTIYMMLDDVTLEAIPTCPPPYGLSTAASGDTIVVHWNERVPGQSYEVVYGVPGFDPDEETGISVSEDSLLVDGLTMGDAYEFYVRTDCGSEYSQWIGPVTAVVGLVEYNMAVTGTHTLTGCAFNIYDDGGPNNDYSADCQSTLYVYPADNEHVISVSGTSYTESSFDYLRVYEGIGTTGTVIFDDYGTSATQTFGPYISESGPITIVFHSDGSVFYDGFEINAICVPAPACQLPSNVTVFNVTNHEATISWNENENYNSMNVYWGTGATIASAIDSTVVNGDNSFTITGLAANTTYHAWIKASCDDGDSRDVEVTFTTDINCYPVTGLSVTPGPVSAMATWTQSRSEWTDLTVEYKEASDTAWTIATTTLNYFPMTGLTPATNYNFRIITTCVEGTSVAATANFRTTNFGCLVADSATVVQDTIGTGSGTSSYFPTYSTYDYSLTQQIYLASDFSGVSGGQIEHIGIQMQAVPVARTIEIYMTNTSATNVSSGFIPIAASDLVWSGSTTGNIAAGWNDITLTVPFNYTGGNILVTFRDMTGSWSSGNYGYVSTANSGISRYIYQDGSSYSVTNPPSGGTASNNRLNMYFLGGTCLTPSTCAAPIVVANAAGTNAIDLNWVPGASETSWLVYIREMGDTVYTLADTVNTTNYTATGLNPGLDYEFQVVAICENNTNAGYATAATECAPVTVPYTEDFENHSGVYARNCWTIGSTELGTSYPYPTVVSLTGDPNKLCLIYNGGYMIMPEMNAQLNTLQARFTFVQGGDDVRLILGLMTDPTAPIQNIIPLDTLIRSEYDTTSSSVTITFPFDMLDDTVTGHITFWDAFNDNYSFIDNLVIEPIPACTAVTGVSASNVTTTGATITWDAAGNSATGYLVEYGPRNFVPGTGTGTVVSAATNTLTLTGLNHSSDYDVYVYTVCSGLNDTSINSNRARFTTPCDVATLPYFENFDNTTDPGISRSPLPNCWNYTMLSTGTYSGASYTPAVYYTTTANYTSSGDYCLYLYGTALTVLPEMPTTVDSLYINFHHYTSSPASYRLIIGAVDSITPGFEASFVGIDTLVFTANENNVLRFLSTYTGSSRYIAFKNIYNNNSYDYSYHYIDDLTVDYMPSCVWPVDMHATGLTTTTAEFAWSICQATDYEYEYGPAGFTPGTGTTGTWNSAPYGIGGLTLGTQYDIYVRGICGAGDTSEWSSYTFSTLNADPATVPFYCDFTDTTLTNAGWEVVNGTQNNKWYVGNAESNGTPRALYISDDNGATNGYTISGISITYAYRDVILTDGQYAISYDWRASGESNYDYIRAWLVPASQMPTAGYLPDGTTSSYTFNSSGVAPAGWISIDGGVKLNQMSSWQTYEEELNIPAGTYHLLFMWANDGSGGTQPPAAIDNVTLALNVCPISNITLVNASATSLQIAWNGNSSGYELEYGPAGFIRGTGVTMTTTDTTATLTGLTGLTNYDVYLRGFCNMTDTSRWYRANFTTAMCDNVTEILSYDTAWATTTSSYAPIGYSFYNYGYVQTLIDSAQFAGLVDDITAFAFSPANTTAGDKYENMTVWMANVPETVLSSNAIVPDSNHVFVKVIDNTSFSYTTTDWQIHGFDTVFHWDGHSNVLVSVKRDNGSYTSGASFNAHSTTGIKTHYYYQDSGPISHTAPSATSSGTASYVGDMIFYSCGAGCPMPVVTNVTVEAQAATVTVNGNGTAFELQYGTDNADLGNPMTSTTGVFNITGLQPETQYFYAVRQQCDTALFSNWYTGTFTTDELGCLPPTGLTATETGYTSASFSWTMGNQETAWELNIFNTTIDTVIAASTTSVTVTGLDNNKTFSAAVRALCGTAADVPGPWSDTITFSTDSCYAVGDIQVTPGSTMASISWTGTSTSYRIRWSEAPFSQYDALEATVTTNSYTITNLDPQTTYAFVIFNNCAEGVSTATSISTFTTLQGGSEPTMYTITAVANNPAWGTVTGGGTFVEGSSTTLTATPNTGYRFVQWADGNTDNPRTVTVTANATYTANFEAIPTYTITVSANDPTMGTVTGGGTYEEGTEVTLTATPNDGYQFVQWNDAVTDAVRTITVTANANYVATFADTSAQLVYHTVTANVNDPAMGSVTGGGSYVEGSTATLTATPNTGYRFVEWDDHNTDNPRSFTVNEDMSFTAVFEAIPTFTVTVSANDPTMGSVTGGGNYLEGSTATVTATANSGYRFVKWDDNVTDNPRTFTVTADVTLTALFEAVENGIGDVTVGTVSLYPNPASTSVTLGLEGFEGEVRIDVVDISGRAVYTANTTSSTVSIDVNDMPQGAYFVRVTSGSRTAVSKLIVR